MDSAEKVFAAVRQGMDAIYAFLKTHKSKIDHGYINGEDELTISMSVKIQSSEQGGFDTEWKTSWTAEKIKASGKIHVDPDQLKMNFKNTAHG